MNFQQALTTILSLSDFYPFVNEERILKDIVANGTPAAVKLAEDLLTNDFSHEDHGSYTWNMGVEWGGCPFVSKHAVIAFAKAFKAASLKVNA